MERQKSALTIERYFSTFGDPYKDPKNIMDYSARDATIRDSSGKDVEHIEGLIFPSFWSQNASNTVATKYFRREGVPETGRETDIRQLCGRIAKTTAKWGIEQKYFDKKNPKILEEEIVAAMVGQYGFYNSPTEFNLGLDIYGISHDEEGFYMQDGKVKKVKNYFENPQLSACFICSPEDSIAKNIAIAVNKVHHKLRLGFRAYCIASSDNGRKPINIFDKCPAGIAIKCIGDTLNIVPAKKAMLRSNPMDLANKYIQYPVNVNPINNAPL